MHARSPFRAVSCRLHQRATFHHPADDAGFTLIELMVSMLILTLVMTGLIGVFVSSAETIAQAKQRQQATALATQTMEQLRALPYDLIAAGVRRNSGTPYNNDAYITDKSSGTPRFVVASSSIAEDLVTHTAATTTNTPLNPHLVVKTVENVQYTVAAYVTRGGTTQTSYNLTVLVSYGSSVSDGARLVVQRSTSYSPAGCLSTSTHPFSGPCDASFSATAGITAGSVQITGRSADPDASDPFAAQFGVQSVALELPMLNSSTAIEQTANVSSGGQTSALRVVEADGDPVLVGGESATADADTDPSSDAPPTDAFTLTQGAAPFTWPTGTSGAFSATFGSTDSGSGAASVTGGTACQAITSSGSSVQVTSTQPCASAAITPSGAMSLDALMNLAGSRQLPIDLATVTGSGAPDRTFAGRLTQSNAYYCSGTPNCAAAHVRRSLGSVVLHGLPNAARTTPAFDVLRLTGVVDEAKAESGVGARTATLPTRTIASAQYWNDGSNTYENLDLSQEFTSPEITATRTYDLGGGIQAEVTIEYIVSTTPGTVESVTTPCDTTTPCIAKVTSAPTVAASIAYRVVEIDGGSRRDPVEFESVLDLGGVLAETAYRAAPGA